MTLFGIKNCDTVRKARKWLEQNNLSVNFHDVREDELTEELVKEWSAIVGWETLFNKRSTSFRNLTDAEKMTSTRKRP